MVSREWDATLASIARDILRKANIVEPPVDPIEIACRLEFRVLMDDRLGARALSRESAQATVIVLGPEERYERLCFATAHEIGESHTGLVWERSAWDPKWLTGDVREDVANRLAGHLLCPRNWFWPSALESDFDLPRLKRRFATASHEVIAKRMLDFDIPTVITVYDKGRRSKRLANFEGRSSELPIEQKVWKKCHTSGSAMDVSRDGLRVQAWPVHEDGWKREIVRTTPLDWA